MSKIFLKQSKISVKCDGVTTKPCSDIELTLWTFNIQSYKWGRYPWNIYENNFQILIYKYLNDKWWFVYLSSVANVLQIEMCSFHNLRCDCNTESNILKICLSGAQEIVQQRRLYHTCSTRLQSQVSNEKKVYLRSHIDWPSLIWMYYADFYLAFKSQREAPPLEGF